MKNNKGFSLVELIVVIAIMAILAAVAVVGYSVYVDRARDAADEQYLADVVYQAELFAIENQIELQQVVVAPEVDGPEDILLIVGWDGAGNPIYYTGDTSEIWQAVGNATLQGGLNNGTFVPDQPEIPEKNEGSEQHEHATVLAEHKDPTCQHEGYDKYACDCGYVEVDILNRVDHNYPASPNAVQGGFAYYVCADCGKIIIKSTGNQPIVPIG